MCRFDIENPWGIAFRATSTFGQRRPKNQTSRTAVTGSPAAQVRVEVLYCADEFAVNFLRPRESR
jgi:hypothetical protein